MLLALGRFHVYPCPGRATLLWPLSESIHSEFDNCCAFADSLCRVTLENVQARLVWAGPINPAIQSQPRRGPDRGPSGRCSLRSCCPNCLLGILSTLHVSFGVPMSPRAPRCGHLSCAREGLVAARLRPPSDGQDTCRCGIQVGGSNVSSRWSQPCQAEVTPEFVQRAGPS